MDRHVAALLPYNTRLSLRRRVADCGNPRDWRDQMDRHVASLLAMTIGEKVHCSFHTSRFGLGRTLLMNTRCHCEGSTDVAALLPYNTRLSLRRRVADCGNPRDWRDQMDRHVASLLAMTIGEKVHCSFHASRFGLGRI